MIVTARPGPSYVTTIGSRAAVHGYIAEIMSRDTAKARAVADQIGAGATAGTFGETIAG